MEEKKTEKYYSHPEDRQTEGRRVSTILETELKSDDSANWMGRQPTGRQFAWVRLNWPWFGIQVRVPVVLLMWYYTYKHRQEVQA